jgi:6-phosphofructokinase
MQKRNIIYAQSGGPTAVINASACGLIQAAREHSDKIGTVFAAKNGITGVLNEELFDTSLETDEAIESLLHSPASEFGSCRYKLKNIEQDDSEYRRLIEVFAAHDIGYFFYNGGNDSQDTAYKISEMGSRLGYPVTCIGIPKTIDNDLAHTDNCPGFGSAAKFIAISTRETARDLASMAASSTKVFILEVMGRHAGWLAASAGLAAASPDDAPHIILFPEVGFDEARFLEKVELTVNTMGYCVIVVSEGIRSVDGRLLQEGGLMDAFGHEQLGGVAPLIAKFIKNHLGYKYHWANADYLQRCARHIASQTDLDQAYALGKSAVEMALAGKKNVMLTIERKSSSPYRWEIGSVPLSKVAGVESKLPLDFIREDGFGISEKCREYLQPLIVGEAYPPYQNGLPHYTSLKKILTPRKL